MCGCDSIDTASPLPIERIAFPVHAMKIGETKYVMADALRCDKSSHRMHVYSDAPTFNVPYKNIATIALKRNDRGFDVDLSASDAMFIPIDKPTETEYAVTSVNADFGAQLDIKEQK